METVSTVEKLTREQALERIKDHLRVERGATNKQLDVILAQYGYGQSWGDFARIRQELGIFKRGGYLQNAPAKPKKAAPKESKRTARVVQLHAETKPLPAIPPTLARITDTYKKSLLEHGFNEAYISVTGESSFIPQVTPIKY